MRVLLTEIDIIRSLSGEKHDECSLHVTFFRSTLECMWHVGKEIKWFVCSFSFIISIKIFAFVSSFMYEVLRAVCREIAGQTTRKLALNPTKYGCSWILVLEVTAWLWEAVKRIHWHLEMLQQWFMTVGNSSKVREHCQRGKAPLFRARLSTTPSTPPNGSAPPPPSASP